MKIWRFTLIVKRQPKPLPAEIITALSQFEALFLRMDELALNVKETRQRLETVYRKVYRDIEREDRVLDADQNLIDKFIPAGASPTRTVRPGDPFK